MFDRQRLIDDAERHMRRQNKRSGRKGDCAYRSVDGLKCAIGACIPDDKYGPYLEGLSAGYSGVRSVLEEVYGQVQTYELYDLGSFLRDVQSVHDNMPTTLDAEDRAAERLDYYNAGYSRVRQRYGLKPFTEIPTSAS